MTHSRQPTIGEAYEWREGRAAQRRSLGSKDKGAQACLLMPPADSAGRAKAAAPAAAEDGAIVAPEVASEAEPRAVGPSAPAAASAAAVAAQGADQGAAAGAPVSAADGAAAKATAGAAAAAATGAAADAAPVAVASSEGQQARGINWPWHPLHPPPCLHLRPPYPMHSHSNLYSMIYPSTSPYIPLYIYLSLALS